MGCDLRTVILTFEVTYDCEMTDETEIANTLDKMVEPWKQGEAIYEVQKFTPLRVFKEDY